MSHSPLPSDEIPRYLGAILGLVTAADFIASSSVIVTSEHIRGGIAASPEDFLNILTAYAVMAMIEIPFIERLARRWHYRDLMLGGLSLFVLGSLMATLCDHSSTLILARIVQGIGGGGLFTMSRVYLQLAVPAPERPRQLKAYMVGLLGAVAPASWLATQLVQDYGWQAVFLMQAAVGVLALGLTASLLKSERHTPRSLGEIDWPMVLSFALGAVLLLHVLEGLQIEILDARATLTLGAALALLGFASLRLHRHADPLLNARVLQGKRFLYGLGFYCLYYLINGASAFILPKLFEPGLGLTTESTGMLLSYSGIITVALLPVYFKIAGKLGDRRRVIAAGFAICAAALYWLACVCTTSTPAQALLGALSLRGIFPILGVIQIAGLAYRDLPHEDFAHAYALKNIGRQLATLVSASIASQMWQHWAAQYRSDMVASLPVSPAIPPETLSRMVEQQATVLTGNHLMQVLALLCVLIIPLVVSQKSMR